MVLTPEEAARLLPAPVMCGRLSRSLVLPILMQSHPPGLTSPQPQALFMVHLVRPAWLCAWAQGRAGKIRGVSAHKNPTLSSQLDAHEKLINVKDVSLFSNSPARHFISQRKQAVS